MYSPCTSTKFSKAKGTDVTQERDVIMSSFYETELPELVEFDDEPEVKPKQKQTTSFSYD